jgi:hypothetical protein
VPIKIEIMVEIKDVTEQVSVKVEQTSKSLSIHALSQKGQPSWTLVLQIFLAKVKLLIKQEFDLLQSDLLIL